MHEGAQGMHGWKLCYGGINGIPPWIYVRFHASESSSVGCWRGGGR
jgi:hypothetical protein